MPRKLGKDVFIRRRAPLAVNPRDNTEYRDWDNAEEIEVRNAQVQPFLLSEKLNFEWTKEREFARTGMRFFAPTEVNGQPFDIDATDRIVYRGKEYTVLGHEGIWTNFSGRIDHIAFIARLREG